MSSKCELCDMDLSVRPVWKDIESTDAKGRPLKFRKRVMCKPIQFVLTARVEGSGESMEFEPIHQDGALLHLLRICGSCIRPLKKWQALAVLVDSKLESGQ